MRRQMIIIGLGVLGALALPASPAMARFVMTLDDLSTPGDPDVTVVDNTDGVGTVADANNQDGVISFSGAVGSFIVNFTTAISTPITDGIAEIGVNSINISGGIGGDLQVTVTDTGFTADPGQYLINNDASGVSDGTVTFQSFIDLGNNEFGMDGQSTPETTLGGNFDSVTTLTGLDVTAAPFSLTTKFTVSHDGAGDQTLFNQVAEFTTPEPGSLAVWSILAGIGLFVAQRRRLLG